MVHIHNPREHNILSCQYIYVVILKDIMMNFITLCGSVYLHIYTRLTLHRGLKAVLIWDSWSPCSAFLSDVQGMWHQYFSGPAMKCVAKLCLATTDIIYIIYVYIRSHQIIEKKSRENSQCMKAARKVQIYFQML